MFRRQGRKTIDSNDAVSYISDSPHPMATWWGQKAVPDWRFSPYMGAGAGGMLIRGRPHTHLLALGSPQSGPGKTASIAEPNAIGHFGPVVLVTTKWDAVRNVVAPRVWVDEGRHPWQYEPTGPIDPGFRQLRISPLSACVDDATTAQMWKVLVDSAIARDRIDTMASPSDPRWLHLAASLGCGLMRFAGAAQHRGQPYNTAWVTQMLQLKDFDTLQTVSDWLIAQRSVFGPGFEGHLTTGATSAGGREVHGVFTTAQIVFEPWATKEAQAVEAEPNFDADAFVAARMTDNEWLRDPYHGSDPHSPAAALRNQGIWPVTGAFPTIVISIPQHRQLLAAPLIITLIKTITEAAIKRKALDEREGIYGRPNVGLVLDELANLAPLPDLPRLLSEGASQGVTVYGCLQNATQSIARWGEREGGHAMLANFGNVIGLPGITDPYTLGWFEQLGGHTVRPTRSNNYQFGTSGRSGYSDGHEEVWRFPQDLVRTGHPQHPDLAVMVQSSAMDWAYCTPVHRARPWLPIVLESFVGLMDEDYLAENPAAAQLPAPDLDRFGTGQFLTPHQYEQFRGALKRRRDVASADVEEAPAS